MGADVTAEILVLNAGSSSIKVSLFGPGEDGPALKFRGQVEGIGTPRPQAAARDVAGNKVFEEKWPGGGGPKDHHGATAFVVARLTAGRPDWRPAGVGHRVVHGGARFREPIRVDAGVRAQLQALAALDPLHVPANLQGIDAAAGAFPGVPHVACFDTAFHHGRPFAAEAYALPLSFYDEGVRRYGFHGLSYEYIVRAMRQTAPEVAAGRMVVAHLGNGASLCATRDGKSVETTMGFTALDGLVMGTRSGQLDPGVVLHLLEEKKMSAGEVSDLLWKRSGLLGLSGASPDMRDLLASADPHAREAVDAFVYRVTYHVGALTAALGGIDGLVFTGGIGEHAALIRERVCRGLAWLGLELDSAANERHQPCISTPASKVSAWVVPTDEERMIALHVTKLLGL
jgi:acetate kinase